MIIKYVCGVSITLKNLFDNYKEFEEIVKDKTKKEIDLRNLNSNPTTILPLLCGCKNRDLKVDGANAYKHLKRQLKSNELFDELPKSRIESDEIDFITKYMENLDSSYGSYFALRHIVSELANNVYDHARGENDVIDSFIFSKHYPNLKKLDICVVDDGLSIPGLFDKSNVSFIDDCHALEKAIGTFSTVSDTFFERGNGLRTITRLVAEGNGGELLLVSRNGLLHICGENYNYFLLDEKHTFNGTLVCLRLNRYEIQNIYQLLEPQKLNSYKYWCNDDY